MYNLRSQNADGSVSKAELDGDTENAPESTGGVPIPNHVRMTNPNGDTAIIGNPNMGPSIHQAGIYEPEVGGLWGDEGNVTGTGSGFGERGGGPGTLGYEQGLWAAFLGTGGCAARGAQAQ